MAADLIQFRSASPADASTVADIHDAAWRSTYRGLIPHLYLERMIHRRGPAWWQRQLQRGSDIELLLFDGQPQGYASYGRARGAWPWAAGEIFELYMSPAFQGVGLGKRLFSTVSKRLAREGLHRLVVWALQENEGACSFYRGLGGAVATSTLERFGETALTRVAFVWGVNAKRGQR